MENCLSLYQLIYSSYTGVMFACSCLCFFIQTPEASSLTAVCVRDGPWAGLWQALIGWWGGGAVVLVVVVTRCKPFALLLLHKELHHEDLLLVHLEADVLGDVWDQPIHKVTHKHHYVLHGREQKGTSHCSIGPQIFWHSNIKVGLCNC